MKKDPTADEMFGTVPPGKPVTSEDFDPCADYRPRGRYVFAHRWVRLPAHPDAWPHEDNQRLKEEELPNINDAFPSNYLKASDLQGRAVVVTIDRVEFEPVGRDKEMKAVIYFIGKSKGVVLNKTNAKKITELAGSALTEEWHGVAIVLYPTETEFAGETVECIRVKAVQKAAPRRQPPPPPDPPAAADDDDQTQLTDDQIPF